MAFSNIPSVIYPCPLYSLSTPLPSYPLCFPLSSLHFTCIICYFLLSRDPSHPSTTTTVPSYVLLIFKVIYTHLEIQSQEWRKREHEALDFLGLGHLTHT